jgi:hypothetical protein
MLFGSSKRKYNNNFLEEKSSKRKYNNNFLEEKIIHGFDRK